MSSIYQEQLTYINTEPLKVSKQKRIQFFKELKKLMKKYHVSISAEREKLVINFGEVREPIMCETINPERIPKVI